jgi:hypothetical protein
VSGQAEVLALVAYMLSPQPNSFTANFEQTIGSGRDFPAVGVFPPVMAERQDPLHDDGLDGVRHFSATLLVAGLQERKQLLAEFGRAN